MYSNLKIIATIIAIAFYANCFAQFSIGKIKPKDSAMLEIVSDSKGLLIPRVKDTNSVSNPDTALLIYSLKQDKFFYRDSKRWQPISTFKFIDTSSNIITIPDASLTIMGNANINGKATIFNTLKVEKYVKITDSLNVDGDITTNGKFVGFGTVPIGGIIMWSGNTAPDGFKLCIGKGKYIDWQDTLRDIPDLRGRFIVGYGANGTGVANDLNNQPIWQSDYSLIGKSNKGEVLHKLTKAELPKHQHSLTTGMATSDGSKHKHNFNMEKWVKKKIVKKGGATENNYKRSMEMQSKDGAHTHDLSGNTGNGTTDGVKESAHENRPPYYVLAFIIRVQ